MADETDRQLQNSNQAIEFGRECIRTGILINGGAAVAVLTLLPRNLPPDNAIDALEASLIWFAIGVLSAMLACIGGYIAQTLFASMNYHLTRGEHTASAQTGIRAGWITLVTAFLVIVSVVCFIGGIWSAAQGLA